MLIAEEQAELAFVCCRLRVLADGLTGKTRRHVDAALTLLLQALDSKMSASMISARIQLAISVLQRRLAEITEGSKDGAKLPR